MIHVIAVITAKPGQRDNLLAAFKDNLAAVKAERGCIEYGATVDTQGIGSFQTEFGPDTLVVLEKWADAAALAAHARAPHMQAYVERTADLIVDRRIHILSPT